MLGAMVVPASLRPRVLRPRVLRLRPSPILRPRALGTEPARAPRTSGPHDAPTAAALADPATFPPLDPHRAALAGPGGHRGRGDPARPRDARTRRVPRPSTSTASAARRRTGPTCRPCSAPGPRGPPWTCPGSAGRARPPGSTTPRPRTRTRCSASSPAATSPCTCSATRFGGAIALSVAARRPELVRTLTLVSPAMPDRRPDPRRMADVRLALALIPGRIGDRARAGLAAVPPRVRAEQVVRVCFGDPTRVPEHRLVEAAEDIADRSGLAWAQEAGERTARGLMLRAGGGARRRGRRPPGCRRRPSSCGASGTGWSHRGWPPGPRPRSPGRGCSCCPASGTSPRSRRPRRWRRAVAALVGRGDSGAPPGKMAAGLSVERR